MLEEICLTHIASLKDILKVIMFKLELTPSCSDHVNHGLQLDARQESDSRLFGWQICLHQDPCPWQKFGSRPMKLHLLLNYPP